MKISRLYRIVSVIGFLLIIPCVWALDPAFDVYRSIKVELKTIGSLVEKNIVGQDRATVLSSIEELNRKIEILLKYASVSTNTITDESLVALEKRLQDTSDFGKVEIITDTLKTGFIYSKQLARLIGMFSFDSYRETTVLNIRESIVDPINIGLVLEKFEFEINRRSIEHKLSKE